jgi:hypothetical protein
VVAEDSTAAVAEDSTAAVAEDSTAAVAEDSTGVAEQGFTGVEVSTAEATLGTAADTTTEDIVVATTGEGATTEDIVAATTEDGATTEVAAVMAGAAGAGATAGAADIGGEDTVMDGAGDGDLASGGRIGVGDIRMTTPTARGITRQTLIILTRTIQILATGTTTLHQQIPTRGPSPTRTDPQDPGDPQHREAQPTRTTQTATSRPLRRVGRFSPLTG